MGKKKDKRERKERDLEEREWQLEERERLARDREALGRERAAAMSAAQPLPGLERLAPDPAVEIAGLRRRAPRVLDASPVADAPEPAGVSVAREIVTRLAGARLVYGEPVAVGGRTVIPVARIKARGGLGFGGGAPEGEPAGGGGGGLLDATPMGFIDVDRDGARYTPIASAPRRAASTAGALAALGVAAGLAGAVLGARRRTPASGRRRLTRRSLR